MAHRKRTVMPVGIHLNAESVQMVQLGLTDNGVEIISTAAQTFAVPADNGAGLARPVSEAEAAERFAPAREFIRTKMTTDGFKGKDVVVSLPSSNLAIQHLRLPPMPGDELAAALPYELQGKLPFEVKDAVVRHILAGTVSENNEPKQDVIVLAARRGSVERAASMMGRLGLNVVGVGIEPCAMCTPYAYASSQAPATQEGPPGLMIVYLAPEYTYVAIVRGPETTFVKGIEHGTAKVVDAIAASRKITGAEAFALRAKWCDSPTAENLAEAVELYNSVRWSLEHYLDEIESCMRYHASLARGLRVDRLHFVGPEARDRALVRILSASLTVPCEVGDPMGAIVGGAVRHDVAPQMAVAVGLSLFGAA